MTHQRLLRESMRTRCPTLSNAKASRWHERPLDGFFVRSDFDEDSDDVEMAAWSLFRDMDQMRKYIQDTWTSYRKGHTNLVTASFITTEAVEIVKEMENEFLDTSPPCFAGGPGTYTALLATIFELADAEVPGIIGVTDNLPEEKQKFLMTSTWVALHLYRARIIKGVARTLPSHFEDFDPGADTLAWTRERRERKDENRMNRLFLRHTSRRFICRRSYRVLAVLRRLLAGRQSRNLRCFATSIPSLMTTSALSHSISFSNGRFGRNILANRYPLDHPLDQFHEIARNVINASRRWMQQGFDPQLYKENYVGKSKGEVGILVWQLGVRVLTDRLAQWKQESPEFRSRIISFRNFLYNPVVCGVAIIKSMYLPTPSARTSSMGLGCSPLLYNSTVLSCSA